MNTTEMWHVVDLGKFVGDWDEFPTYVAAKEFMDQQVAKARGLGEQYHFSVERVTRVAFASSIGVGR